MTEQPQLWAQILDWCADITAQFITAQVLHGASALQVFDSWAGRLTVDEYRQFAMPHTARLFRQLSGLTDKNGTPVPRVHFGVETRDILQDMYQSGATVIGVDFQTDLSEASSMFLDSVPVQGNIDPDILTQPWSEIEAHVRHVIAVGSSAPGHVVNLGHGVPPMTEPDVLTRIVALVHSIQS